jgi:hypothetical protein
VTVIDLAESKEEDLDLERVPHRNETLAQNEREPSCLLFQPERRDACRNDEFSARDVRKALILHEVRCARAARHGLEPENRETKSKVHGWHKRCEYIGCGTRIP